MRHLRKQLLRYTIASTVILVFFISTGYALFSQQLTTNTTVTKPAYSSSNNLYLTYTKTLNGQIETFTITIKNNGSNAVSSWQASFNIPTDFSQLSCSSTVSCSTSGSTVTVVNGSGNGTISGGGSVTFTMNFTSASTNWTLQNIVISGTAAPTYRTISGLTVSISIGTKTKNKGLYYWPYTFTVTNSSGNSVSAWRIQAPWFSNTYVNSMSSTVDYVTDSSQITISSKSSLANSSSFQFSATLSSSSSAFSLYNYVIQGIQ